jgi:hypothetical protein
MSSSLSIKNVPNEIVERLKRRAARNHRSLQGELMALLEETIKPASIDVRELRDEILALGLSTPDESTSILRAWRSNGLRSLPPRWPGWHSRSG